MAGHTEGGAAWVILVGGYGAFLFDGTAAEAEEMRVHKARWERGIGRLREATPAEVESGKPSQCWNHPNFASKCAYQCNCDDEDCVANAFTRMESSTEPQA